MLARGLCASGVTKMLAGRNVSSEFYPECIKPTIIVDRSGASVSFVMIGPLAIESIPDSKRHAPLVTVHIQIHTVAYESAIGTTRFSQHEHKCFKLCYCSVQNLCSCTYLHKHLTQVAFWHPLIFNKSMVQNGVCCQACGTFLLG